VHFSHPFLGTYEVVQFLELGNLKGTHSMVPFQYQTTSYQATSYQYQYQYQAIPSFQTCHRVSGVLFTKYANYFCRLKYWSIGLHFFWTGSSGFADILSNQGRLYMKLPPLKISLIGLYPQFSLVFCPQNGQPWTATSLGHYGHWPIYSVNKL